MKTRFTQITGLIVVIFLLGLCLMMVGQKVMNRNLEVLYPISLLRQGPELLDPDNTETIWEYYLLENLSCGLIRDSQTSLTGYEGCIAETYYQENQYTWAFKIRNLQWSDGTSLSKNEIENWLKDLKSQKKRHIKYLKHAKNVSYDSESRTLRIEFPFQVDQTILHELSLADAGLVPVDFFHKGWGKVIGPYFVKSWNQKENLLELGANPYSPLYRKGMPMVVKMRALKDIGKRTELFKSIPVDIVPINATMSPKAVEQVLPNAAQIYTSHPMSLIYFYFNFKNPQTHDFKNREFFASVIAKIRPQITQILAPLKIYSGTDQMIPNGFHGHLKHVMLNNNEMKSTLKKMKIRLPKNLEDFPNLPESLILAFRNEGVEAILEFSNSLEFNDDQFSGVHNFIGNQIDSSGSWAFLTSGTLSPWLREYEQAYKNVFENQNLKNRQSNLQSLHQRILERYIAVPFFIGSQRYLLSERVNPLNWNRFDSRLRIYELSWN